MTDTPPEPAPDPAPRPTISPEVLALTGVSSAVQQLAIKVESLTRQATLTQQQTKALRDQGQRLKRYLVGLLAVSVLSIGAAGLAWNASDGNRTNAVRACQNSNSRTEGQQLLWDTLIGKSIELNEAAHAPDKDVQQLRDLQALEQALFAPRDCSDLNRKYPLPDVPESLRTKP